MLNPEQAFFNKRMVNERVLSSSEKAVYKWYLKNPQQINARKERYYFEDMKKFIDIYGEDEVKKDIKSTRYWRDKDNSKDMSQRAEMLEAIMITQADMNEWYGDMSISKTSEYDDYENHTDAILHGETKDGEEVFIGIDWTVSENEEIINKKIARVKREVERGNLSRIKYFESSEDDEDRRGLDNVPRVIIAMPDAKFKKLCEQTIKVINREEGSVKSFSKSELQIYVLEEIKDQLEGQLKLIDMPGKRNYKKNVNAKKSIKRALDKINEIYVNE